MKIKENLIKVFNQYKVEANDETLEIAKHLGFKHTNNGAWVAITRIVMNEQMSILFKRFLKLYNKHYRVDVAAKEFYQLTDIEIEDMFEELPYYLELYKGRETYKPNAASFLKERIWNQDYPGKRQRVKPTKVSLDDFRDWDSYIAFLPEHSRSFAEAYKDLISFKSFKEMVRGNQ